MPDLNMLNSQIRQLQATLMRLERERAVVRKQITREEKNEAEATDAIRRAEAISSQFREHQARRRATVDRIKGTAGLAKMASAVARELGPVSNSPNATVFERSGNEAIQAATSERSRAKREISRLWSRYNNLGQQIEQVQQQIRQVQQQMMG